MVAPTRLVISRVLILAVLYHLCLLTRHLRRGLRTPGLAKPRRRSQLLIRTLATQHLVPPSSFPLGRFGGGGGRGRRRRRWRLPGELEDVATGADEGVDGLAHGPVTAELELLLGGAAERTLTAVVGQGAADTDGAEGVVARRQHGRLVEVLTHLAPQGGLDGGEG